MSVIPAIFENGVFRPTGPVALPDHCEVDLEFHVRPSANGGANWEAAARAAQELQMSGYDFDAWQQQREFDSQPVQSLSS